MKKAFLLLALFFVVGSVTEYRRTLWDEYYATEGTDTLQESNVFLGRLAEKGYSVELNREKLTEEKLKGYDVLVFQFPEKVLDEQDIDIVSRFVARGGGLVILGQWTRGSLGWNADSRESFNRLGGKFGVIFDANSVDDTTNKAGCHCTPIIHVIKPHEVTKNLKNLVLWWPCSLSLKKGDVLATGDEDTTTIGEQPKYGEEIILVAASEYGLGRVVAIGSSGVFQNRWTEFPIYDNLAFGINVMEWVSHTQEKSQKTRPDMLGFVIGILYLLFVIVFFETLEGFRKKEI